VRAKRLVCSSLVLVALAARLAAAQPTTVPATAAAPSKFANPQKAIGKPLGLMLGGMALFAIIGGVADFRAGMATGGVMATIGPSAAHISAGEKGHALVTSCVRGAALGVVTYAAVQFFGWIDDDRDEDPPSRPEHTTELVLGGLGVYAAVALYDIIDAPSAFRRARRREAAHVTVAPTVVSAGGTRAPGLVLGGTF